MGWAVGWDETWQRDVGYGVPAFCDHPGCGAEIDRGLAYVCCDQEPYGGDEGCGLFFCSAHQTQRGRCDRCLEGKPPFEPTTDHPTWLRHKLTDPSWERWRSMHPSEVDKIREGMDS